MSSTAVRWLGLAASSWQPGLAAGPTSSQSLHHDCGLSYCELMIAWPDSKITCQVAARHAGCELAARRSVCNLAGIRSSDLGPENGKFGQTRKRIKMDLQKDLEFVLFYIK